MWGGGGSHEVMLSLSVKQQKQGPAEIACCLSTFLAKSVNHLARKKQQALSPFIRRAHPASRYRLGRSCTHKYAAQADVTPRHTGDVRESSKGGHIQTGRLDQEMESWVGCQK